MLGAKTRGHGQGRFFIGPAVLGIGEHRVQAFQRQHAEAMALPIAED